MTVTAMIRDMIDSCYKTRDALVEGFQHYTWAIDEQRRLVDNHPGELGYVEDMMQLQDAREYIRGKIWMIDIGIVSQTRGMRDEITRAT